MGTRIVIANTSAGNCSEHELMQYGKLDTEHLSKSSNKCQSYCGSLSGVAASTLMVMVCYICYLLGLPNETAEHTTVNFTNT